MNVLRIRIVNLRCAFYERDYWKYVRRRGKKSVAMEKKFYNVHTLARAQAANGMNKEATATAEESMKLAQEAKNEAYVKMNRELMEKTMSGQGGK